MTSSPTPSAQPVEQLREEFIHITGECSAIQHEPCGYENTDELPGTPQTDRLIAAVADLLEQTGKDIIDTPVFVGDLEYPRNYDGVARLRTEQRQALQELIAELRGPNT